MLGAVLARRASTWYGAGPPALRRQTRHAGGGIQPTACPNDVGEHSELRRPMPSDADAGAGADAGRLAALVPRERRRYLPLDSWSRASLGYGPGRALLRRLQDLLA